MCDAFLRAVPKALAAKAAGGKVTICLMNAGGIRSGYKVRAARFYSKAWMNLCWFARINVGPGVCGGVIHDVSS